jgi:prevent-host-death family protein
LTGEQGGIAGKKIGGVEREWSKLDCELVGLVDGWIGEIMASGERAYTEIGAFDAKTKLSEILRKVEQGERFTITRRGQAVANLVPVAPDRSAARVAAAVEALRNFPKIEGISGDTVLEWIREGRK